MNATTQHTLIAVFRDRAAAQSAVDDLQANGFTSTDIYATGDSGTTTTGTTTRHHEGGIVGWFKSLFGDEDTTEHTAYESAVERGNVAISARVNADQADRAIEILNDHSPVNVEDQDARGDQYASGNQYTTANQYTAGATTTGAAVGATAGSTTGFTGSDPRRND